MKIIKKDGRLENFDFNKIKTAVQKSAARVDTKLSEDQLSILESEILSRINQNENISNLKKSRNEFSIFDTIKDWLK